MATPDGSPSPSTSTPNAGFDFRTTTLAALAHSVRTRQISAKELTEAALRRIERYNPTYNAFVAVDGDLAIEHADIVDATIAEGGDPGPLAGIPIGVKDLQDAAGFRTTYGSALHADDPPATQDSPFVARLRAAGCVIVGKTNTPEFGWMGNTTNAIFGPSRNPFDTSRGPGGSSGGASAALAAGMVPLATGSDGGGSIRIPSACCGLSGMKPSLGRVPAGGPHPPGWVDLSTNGPMARRIADVARALDVTVGPDPTDLRSLPRPEASWMAALDDSHVPVRIAYSPTLGYATVDAEVAAACERAVGVLESMGADVVVVESVFDDDPVGDFLTLTGASTLRTLRPFMDHPRWDEVHPVLRHFVDAAQSTTAERLLQVFDNFHLMNLRLVELFHTCRILVTPTCSAPAPLAGEITSLVNGEETANWVQFTYPFNMTRSPAASVCVGLTSTGLPIGLQLVGPQHGDLVVLRTAAALEGALALDTLASLPD
jgi:Asp-tRNA(Asn)/Glu-tRNA(Gln) amidotransferase A subunit family amidase